MPRTPDPERPSAPRSGPTAWHQQLPGIGLVFGAALGIAVAALSSADAAGVTAGVLIGAVLGLLTGSIARTRVGDDAEG